MRELANRIGLRPLSVVWAQLAGVRAAATRIAGLWGMDAAWTVWMTQQFSTDVAPSPDEAPPAPLWRRCLGARRERIGLLVFLIAVAALYVWSYYFSNLRPRADGQYPLGWWGWFDQGQYLISMKAFATGAVSAEKFFYPPLYPLLAAPFWKLWPTHGAAVYDLILLSVYAGGLVYVARRFYGLVLPAVVCLAMLAFLPLMTLQQWVIPWTSSLSSALEAVLIVLFFRAEQRTEAFTLKTRGSWAEFVLFFLCYGALAPTRPLDIAAWFPFALAFFVRTLIAGANGVRGRPLWLALLQRCAAAAVAGGVSVGLYVTFNLVVQHQLLGSYSAAAGANGYLPKEIVEKILSIFWDARTLFGDNGDALFHRFPIFLPMFAVCAATLFFVRDVRFWILVSAFSSYIISLPYGDLLPTGFFNTFELHYFEWTYPWIAVITVGQVALWFEGATVARSRTSSWIALGVSAAFILAAWNIDIQQRNLVLAPTLRSAAAGTVTVDVGHRRSAQFVDMLGLGGGPGEFALSPRQLLLDGRPIAPTMFRLYPIPNGGRVFLLRPMTFQRMVFTPGSMVKVIDGADPSVVGSVSPTFGCSIFNCTPTPIQILPWKDGVIDFDIRLDHPGVRMDDWAGPEPWGRWTTAKRGRLDACAMTDGFVSSGARTRSCVRWTSRSMATLVDWESPSKA